MTSIITGKYSPRPKINNKNIGKKYKECFLETRENDKDKLIDLISKCDEIFISLKLIYDKYKKCYEIIKDEPENDKITISLTTYFNKKINSFFNKKSEVDADADTGNFNFSNIGDDSVKKTFKTKCIDYFKNIYFYNKSIENIINILLKLKTELENNIEINKIYNITGLIQSIKIHKINIIAPEDIRIKENNYQNFFDIETKIKEIIDDEPTDINGVKQEKQFDIENPKFAINYIVELNNNFITINGLLLKYRQLEIPTQNAGKKRKSRKIKCVKNSSRRHRRRRTKNNIY